jgi:hypothetical protein
MAKRPECGEELILLSPKEREPRLRYPSYGAETELHYANDGKPGVVEKKIYVCRNGHVIKLTEKEFEA